MLFRKLICTSFFVAYVHGAHAMEQAAAPASAAEIISLIPPITQLLGTTAQLPATPLAECSEGLQCLSTYWPSESYLLAALAYLIPHAHDVINHDDPALKTVMTPFNMKNEFSTITNLHAYQLMQEQQPALAAFFTAMHGVHETISNPTYQNMQIKDIVDLKISQVMKAVPTQDECVRHLAAIQPPLKQDLIQSIVSEHTALAQVLTAAQRLLNASNTQAKA